MPSTENDAALIAAIEDSDWMRERLAQAWEDGYAYRAGRRHPTLDPAGVRVGLDNPFRVAPPATPRG